MQVRYQGAPKAGRDYVEIVGLQKLLGLSASLVAIGANPLDFLPTASPSSHHPHRPPGTVNLWVLFPRTYFFLPGAFFRKTFSDRKQGGPLSLSSPSTPRPSPSTTSPPSKCSSTTTSRVPTCSRTTTLAATSTRPSGSPYLSTCLLAWTLPSPRAKISRRHLLLSWFVGAYRTV